MSRANGPNNPANRGVGGHLKEGLKNVPRMYNALYNAKTTGGGKLGVANTVGANVKTVVTGKSSSVLPAKSGATRAKIAALGAVSVTPLGPIVAAGAGIAKSVKDKKAAVAALPKPAAKPAAPLSPQQKQAQKKANIMKDTLNEAFPGLNMKKGRLK